MQVPVVRKEVEGDFDKGDGYLEDLEEGEEEEDTRNSPVLSLYNLAHPSTKIENSVIYLSGKKLPLGWTQLVSL